MGPPKLGEKSSLKLTILCHIQSYILHKNTQNISQTKFICPVCTDSSAICFNLVLHLSCCLPKMICIHLTNGVLVDGLGPILIQRCWISHVLIYSPQAMRMTVNNGFDPIKPCNDMSFNSCYCESKSKCYYGSGGNWQYRNLQVDVYLEAVCFHILIWPVSSPEVCKLHTVNFVLELFIVMAPNQKPSNFIAGE